jgi:MoxR-like ATPase
MHESEFSQWLANDYRTEAGKTMDSTVRSSRMSNCRRVEQFLGDLDEAYERDGMAALLAKLELSRRDDAPRHNIPIDGDLYNGTATLKAATRLYQKFRSSTSSKTSAQFQELDSQLRASLPDDARRAEAARFIARLIEHAAGAVPAAWVLSWRQRRGIFFILTFFRVFAIDRNRIFVAFTTSEAPSELRDAVERARLVPRKSAGYLSLDDTTAAYIPTSFYFERREELERLIERFALRITKKYDTTAFSRFHSNVAVEWVAAQVGRELQSPVHRIEAANGPGAAELAVLVDEFETWCATAAGKAHLRSYSASRMAAIQNLSDLRAARAAGGDLTDLVLRGILPHLDTPTNRERGAWIHIASGVAGDIRMKLKRSDDEWPRIAARIFELVEAALARPDELAAACQAFATSAESPGFQSGMLTPFLSAIDPVHFAILNKKSRVVTNFISGTSFGQSLEEYPAANDAIRAAAAQIADLIDAPDLVDVPDDDLYDAFSHWLLALRHFFDDQTDDTPLFTASAFELFALLDRDPSVAVYQQYKHEFRTLVEDPFRRLFAAIAERLTPEMREVLETERNLFSRFAKNDYGKGGAWPYYWGAFYPKETQRVRGTQLFVYMGSGYVTFGYCAGAIDEQPARRAAAYLRDERRLAADGLDSILGRYAFGDARRIVDDSLFATREACLASGDEADLLDIRKVLRPEEVTMLTLGDLANAIGTAFRELFPLIRFSVADAAAPEDQRMPPYSLAELSANTGFSTETVTMWVRAIERKKQAVLYGPPGTGKTFIAEKLARHLAGGGDGFVETLQFHPAYSYEDFMEGMRPQSSGGGLTYPVVPGRFRAFCDRARQRSGRCVLVIDEINRANLARVLGELMYLLEYRDKSVPLASGTLFSIPPNVRIIGTMNTADRSIALVDHALRRRFAFIALHPDYEVLRNHHENSALANALIAELKQINSEIEPSYRIGISFFMVTPLEQHLGDIWRMEIEPYLEEYFFDQQAKWENALWTRVEDRLRRTERLD